MFKYLCQHILPVRFCDESKTGFARYCPTFRAAYDRVAEGITHRVARRKERSAVCGLLRQGKLEPLVSAIAEDPSRSALVGSFIFNRDRTTMILACAALRNAGAGGTDISPAVPQLVQAFTHRDFFMRLQAMNTLCDALPSLPRAERLKVSAGTESFIANELDNAVLADPGGSPMIFESLLRLMRSIAALEGTHPLSMGKLISELRTHPKGETRCLGE